MSWITILWTAIGSASLTLAAMHVLVWWKRRAQAELLFSVIAVAAAVYTLCELWVVRSETPAAMTPLMRWAHLPIWLILVGLVGFVRRYIGPGWAPLAWVAISLRTVMLFLAFTLPNVNFKAVTAVERVPFLGELASVPVGEPNPWMIPGQLGSVALVLYIVHASVIVWRRGERRKAWLGAAIVFFITGAQLQTMLLFWGLVTMPPMISLFYVAVVASMAAELSRDVVRASQLSAQLQVSEAGLRDSEERFRLAIEAADFGLWIIHIDRDEIWANDKWRALFAFGATERVSIPAIVQRVHPDDRNLVRQTLTSALAGRGAYEIEYRLVLPDGTERWISSTGRIEADAGDQPSLMRGASRDCTARKAAEQELQLLRLELAHAGRVSMLGQLASALAHEINQPLSAIQMNAQAAGRFIQQPSPDLGETRDILADIATDSQRAGAVIHRMRALLKRQDFKREVFGLPELFADATSLVRAEAAARPVTVSMPVATDLPRVSADRVQVQQVLLNLILNAMDAMTEREPHGRQVSVTARRDSARTVEISVADNGTGMAPEVLDRVFEPFFTTKATGMGMGLSISQTIIDAHGGRLWAENNEAGGAVFRFTLPIAERSLSPKT